MKFQQDYKTYLETNQGKENKFEFLGSVLWNTEGGSPLGQAANNKKGKVHVVKCKEYTKRRLQSSLSFYLWERLNENIISPWEIFKMYQRQWICYLGNYQFMENIFKIASPVQSKYLEDGIRFWWWWRQQWWWKI